MGLLDDAIREHLDLKRRRGADPGEIERAEREALGPVRRGPEPSEQVEDTADEALAYNHEHEQDWEQPPPEPQGEYAYPPAADSAPFDMEEPAFDDEAPPPRAAEPGGEFEPLDEPVAADDPFAEPHEIFPESHGAAPAPHAAPGPPESRPPPEHPGEETAEYDVEAANEREERDEHGDDVLEKTPDFLQDTPDHDRLWFEQKPPRDFDFDG
jgi:hypothetical protein